jgi:hypothetical protein
MHDLAQLKDAAAEAQETLEGARASYREAARRCLIAELLGILVERPEVATLEVNAEYEYDDEGGYFHCITGSFTLADVTTEDEGLDEYWTEGLDVEQSVILDLFVVDRAGEGTLTRAQVHALATHEGISAPLPPGAASPSLPSTSREEE